jgi:hypothetical protein
MEIKKGSRVQLVNGKKGTVVYIHPWGLYNVVIRGRVWALPLHYIKRVIE